MVKDLEVARSPEQMQRIVTQAVASSSSGSAEKAAKEAQQRAKALKSLIIKTADEVYSYVDKVVTELGLVYVAKSEFGEYTESISTTIEQTARDTVESYEYTAKIEAVNAALAGLDTYITTINGQIRRGIIHDPDTDEDVLGIAISQNLEFTGSEQTVEGVSYYRLSPGQTLGLYTSTGWQFWIEGRKVGWFDSLDGMLHVTNILVENRLQMGTDWILSTDGGFGIRYIGGNNS